MADVKTVNISGGAAEYMTGAKKKRRSTKKKQEGGEQSAIILKGIESTASIAATSSSTNSNTRFDNYGTKFLSNRDKYTVPGNGDTWLKFPKTKVLQ